MSENKIENNKWYKHISYNNILIFVTNQELGHGYGINQNLIWRTPGMDHWTFGGSFKNSEHDRWIEATKEEILQGLKAEAIRRGYKYNTKIKSLYDSKIVSPNNNNNVRSNEFYLSLDYASKTDVLMLGYCVVFKLGKWAEIVSNESIKPKIDYSSIFTITEDKAKVKLGDNYYDAEVIEEIYKQLQ